MNIKRARILVTIALVFCSLALSVLVFLPPRMRMAAAHMAELEIIRRIPATPVSTNVFPVLIYEVTWRGFYFTQLGGYYTNYTSGVPSLRLLTAGHLFRKRNSPTAFLVRRMFPRDVTPTLYVSKIIKIGEEWGEKLDLAECELIPVAPMGRPPIIPCSFTDNTEEVSLFTPEQMRTADVPKKALVSLFTGEKVMSRGVAVSKDKKSFFIILDQLTLGGHSGHCFLDESERMYFTAKQIHINQRDRHAFSIGTPNPGLAVGPLPFLNASRP